MTSNPSPTQRTAATQPTDQSCRWDNVIEERASTAKHKIAFRFIENGLVVDSISYGDLLTQADQLAALLQSDFCAGERVILLFQPGIDFIRAFFACTRAGLIPVPLSPSLGRHGFASIGPILEDCEAAAVLGPKTLWKRQEAKCAASIKHKLTWIDWEQLQSDATAYGAPRKPADQEGIAFLQYTSGSTGNPKGVIVSHTCLEHNLQQIIKNCAITEDTTMLSWMPHFHDMGLIGGILQTIYSGSQLTLIAAGEFTRKPRLWLEIINDQRIDLTVATESALSLIEQAAKPYILEQLDLSCLKCIVCGGEPIRTSVVERFHAALKPVGLPDNALLCAYGLAEATLMVTAKRFDFTQDAEKATARKTRELVSSGPCINGIHIEIVNPQTLNPIQDNEEGLIMIKGISVNPGYWHERNQTSSTFGLSINGETGYLNSGDLGRLEDDEIYISGRSKDIIITGGRKIHPSDVELFISMFDSDFRNNRNTVFASSDQNWRDELSVVIEHQYKQPLDDAINQLSMIEKAISREFRIGVKEVLLVECNAIPTTTSGKLRRQTTKQRSINKQLNVLIRHPTPAEQATSTNQVLAAIKRAIVSTTHADPVLLDAEQPLSEWVQSSLQLAELKIELDNHLQCDLPIEPFLEDFTLRQLSQQLAEFKAGYEPHPADRCFDNSAALRNLMLAGLPDHLRALQQEHGDWLSLRWGRQVIHLLSDPSEVQKLMQRPGSEFIRGKVFEGIRMVTDDSNLFTTEGPAWQRERQRAQPLLTRQAVEAMAGDFASISQGCLLEHKGANDSATLDLEDLCRAITLKITLHKLFGPISAVMAQRLTKALTAETDWRLPLHYLAQAELREAAASIGASKASFEGLLPELDALVYGAIDAQLSSSTAPTCLLASYLASPEVKAMEQDDRRRYLRSVMLSLVLAGLDSTGSGLFFCLDLLSRQAESQRLVRDEIHTAFGDGDIIPTDLPGQLPYTMAVVQEALRLYPPVWFLGREAVNATTVMGQAVAAGDIVLTSPYVIHRHPGHWSEPEQFRPERFLKQPAAGPGSHLFMPFGVGPRTCVGRWLALYELSLAVAALVQHHQLCSAGETRPELSSYFTLRTVKPISMLVEPAR